MVMHKLMIFLNHPSILQMSLEYHMVHFEMSAGLNCLNYLDVGGKIVRSSLETAGMALLFSNF